MLRETERRAENRSQLIALTADRFSCELLSVFHIQPRLGVKQIDMTRPAPHKQEDNSSRAGRKMRSWQQEWTCSWLALGPGAFTGSQCR
jgi:hypothetical protein